MSTTKYFKQVAEIHKKFSIIQANFNGVIQKAILDKENKDINWDETRKIIDNFDKNIRELKTMKSELISIRAEVGNRGGEVGQKFLPLLRVFFKHGNIKQKLDQIQTIEMIQDLKTEMKDFVNTAKKADARRDDTPIKTYLEEYKSERLSQENKAAVQKIEYP